MIMITRVLSACVKIGQLQTSSNQQATIILVITITMRTHWCNGFVKASTVVEICTTLSVNIKPVDLHMYPIVTNIP